MPTSVEVTTPSRLHFGMFSFGHADERQFGGAGVMINRPGLRLRLIDANQFEAHGPLAHRIRQVIRRLGESWDLAGPPPCRIEVLSAPAEHLGLGTGTQLELAVAAGLNAFLGGAPLAAIELAQLTGRGARSAVGTYGFLHGGLLIESGKQPGQSLAPLERRITLPPAWRWVLVNPNSESGLAGEAERRAFCDLPPVPRETAVQLRAEAIDCLAPAAICGDFAAFSESLYRFGHLAGTCFAASQGGPFASARSARLVNIARSLGVRGVGQSSWGPTLFAALESEASAIQFGDSIAQHLEPGEQWLLTETSSSGARLARQDDA
jgi:beta-ribofuranosylaminobenzene 5'-phosphate synthase